MPWIISLKSCPSCGREHVLCLDQEDVPGARTGWEFTCPATGKTVVTSYQGASMHVRECESSAVRARDAGSGGAARGGRT